MWNKLRAIWKIKDIRNNVLYVALMLVIFRMTAHIPIPGVNTENLKTFLDGNQIFGLLNVFSGGTIENFSIVMLGVAPYITASIIFQVLTKVVPQLEEISEEGEAGQQKIQMYTRLASVPLAIVQAFALIQLLSNQAFGIIDSSTTFQFFTMIVTITAGTVFLMWIGELITEKRIGNGISLLIMAGIISGIPGVLQNALVNYTSSDLFTYILFLIIGAVTIVSVIYISEGQRNIPIRYAKHVHGAGRMRGQISQSFLPLRVNTAGVIPIIFAISIVLFPPLVAQFFITNPGTLGRIANFTVDIFNNQLFYGIIYFVFVFGFTYFYTAIVFHPNKVAENLQRQGGFIPGIRPGKQTEEYIARTMNRLLLIGATFLSAVAVLPLAVQVLTTSQSLVLGGTSLLIIVSVAIDSGKQIEAQITTHQYESI